MGNLCFSLSTVAHMIRVHDPTGRGEIDLQEFQQLHHFLVSMQNSFTYFDRDRGGTLTPDELYQAIIHAGFSFEMLLSFIESRV